MLTLALAALFGLGGAAAQELPAYAAGAKEILDYEPDAAGADGAADRLQEILARPEFQAGDAPPPGPSLWERIIDWISQRIPVGLGNLLGAGETVTLIAAVIIALLLVLLVYALVRALWAKLSQEPVAEGDVDEEQLGPKGLLRLAHQAAAAGDYRAALRYRFRAVVGELGELNSERRTNWQLLRHVRREHPQATQDFAALVTLFEDCWYGGQSAGAAEYARADTLASSVVKQLVRKEEAA